MQYVGNKKKLKNCTTLGLLFRFFFAFLFLNFVTHLRHRNSNMWKFANIFLHVSYIVRCYPSGQSFFEKERFRRRFNPRLLSLSCGPKTILNLSTKAILNFPTKMAFSLPTKMVLNFPQVSERYSICPQKDESVFLQKRYSICQAITMVFNLPTKTVLNLPIKTVLNLPTKTVLNLPTKTIISLPTHQNSTLCAHPSERYSICPPIRAVLNLPI